MRGPASRGPRPRAYAELAEPLAAMHHAVTYRGIYDAFGADDWWLFEVRCPGGSSTRSHARPSRARPREAEGPVLKVRQLHAHYLVGVDDVQVTEASDVEQVYRDFYGFIGGENNQYYPALYEGLKPVEPEQDTRGGVPPHRGSGRPAVDWIRTQRALTPEKPFFMSSPRARRTRPHHVPRGVGKRNRGEVRPRVGPSNARLTFARQKELGVIPAGCRADTYVMRRSLHGTTCPTS